MSPGITRTGLCDALENQSGSEIPERDGAAVDQLREFTDQDQDGSNRAHHRLAISPVLSVGRLASSVLEASGPAVAAVAADEQSIAAVTSITA